MAETQNHPAVEYLLENPALILNRDVVLELMTDTERVVAAAADGATDAVVVVTETPMYAGKLVAIDNNLLSVRSFTRNSATEYVCKLAPTGIGIPAKGRILTPATPVILRAGVLENYPDGPELDTTVGRLVMNYALLADPFGAVIPYQNKLWKPSDIEGLVYDAALAKTVTESQLDKYIANLFHLGQMTEIAVPSFTEKSLVTSPEVKVRRAELLAEHKDDLARGDAATMVKIEQELVALDKQWLKGDASEGFLIESKNWNIHRKNMFLTYGMVEQFGSPGEFDYVGQPLIEGWQRDKIPTLANTVRKGSYGRAMETAKGGEESKFLMRVFQNTRIVEADCGTERALRITLSPVTAKAYLQRNIYTEAGGIEALTEQTLGSYIGHTVRMRSPMFCETVGGFCFTCMGKLFETLDQRQLAMLAVDIGSFFLLLSMKGMHGAVVSVVDLETLDPFLF